MAPDISNIHILVQSRARICEGGVWVVKARIRILIQRHGARLLVTSGGEEHCPGVSIVLTVHVTVNGLVDGLVSLTPGQLTGHDQLAREEQSAAPLVHYYLRVAADPGVVVSGHSPRPGHLRVRHHRGYVLRLLARCLLIIITMCEFGCPYPNCDPRGRVGGGRGGRGRLSGNWSEVRSCVS